MDSDHESSNSSAESSDGEPIAKKSKQAIKTYENPRDVTWTKTNRKMPLAVFDG